MKRFGKAAASILAAVFICITAGCGNTQAVMPLPTATPFIRSTLPPTWTPTFTPSPIPPTLTPTPTLSPTVTLTPGAGDICRAFWHLTNLSDPDTSDGILALNDDQQISIYANTSSPDEIVIFELTHRLTSQSDRLEFPGGQMVGLELPVNQMIHTGQYDWKLYIQSTAYGEVCAEAGTFLVVRPAPEDSLEDYQQ